MECYNLKNVREKYLMYAFFRIITRGIIPQLMIYL